MTSRPPCTGAALLRPSPALLRPYGAAIPPPVRAQRGCAPRPRCCAPRPRCCAPRPRCCAPRPRCCAPTAPPSRPLYGRSAASRKFASDFAILAIPPPVRAQRGCAPTAPRCCAPTAPRCCAPTAPPSRPPVWAPRCCAPTCAPTAPDPTTPADRDRRRPAPAARMQSHALRASPRRCQPIAAPR